VARTLPGARVMTAWPQSVSGPFQSAAMSSCAVPGSLPSQDQAT
jgi:hypothetical protein